MEPRQHKSYFDIRFEDLPEGEPVLKFKSGMWYRPNSYGYTNNPIEAGLYTKEEAAHCFDKKGDNGNCGVYAIPIRKALDEAPVTKNKIKYLRSVMDVFEKYAGEFETKFF